LWEDRRGRLRRTCQNTLVTVNNTTKTEYFVKSVVCFLRRHLQITGIAWHFNDFTGGSHPAGNYATGVISHIFVPFNNATLTSLLQVRLQLGHDQCNNLRQVVHNLVPLSPTSTSWYLCGNWEGNDRLWKRCGLPSITLSVSSLLA